MTDCRHYWLPVPRPLSLGELQFRDIVGYDEGLVLDHVQARGCSTTLCVCPDHLEPVTPRENVLRGRAGYGLRSLCRKGLHDISASENVMVRADGSRTCLPCRRAVMLAANERYRERHPGATAEANRRYRARKKAACTSS